MLSRQRQCEAFLKLLDYYELTPTSVMRGNTTRLTSGKATITFNMIEAVRKEFYHAYHFDLPYSEIFAMLGGFLDDEFK